MRFIKRFIAIIFLLLLAFFVYRLINPSGAKALLNDLKSFSNTTFGTRFSLQEIFDETNTGFVLDITGSIVNATGISNDGISNEVSRFNDTGILQEFSEDNALLLNPNMVIEETLDVTASTSSTGENLPASSSISSSPKKTSSSSQGLSSKDLIDFKHLFSK